MPADAKSVIVDPPGIGEVKLVAAREGKSYWCPTCARRKAASYRRAITRKRAGAEGAPEDSAPNRRRRKAGSTTQTRPDTERVLGGLKDFQRRTVNHVFERLYDEDDPALRFLVADEVGLGKTLVARGVVARAVEHLWDKVGRIDIVYICSNADIARQNLDRLNIGGDEDAVLSSRLTLLANQVRDLETKKVHFISFTPGTSFEKHKGSGRSEERVLLYWLLRSPWALGTGVAPVNVLQAYSQPENFRPKVARFDPRRIDPIIRRAFRERLRAHEDEARADGRETLRRRFRRLCEQMPRTRSHSALPEEVRTERIAVIADLRAVLAAACVTALEPDLVILDEFQRFRYLLDPHDDASKLAHELFNYSQTHEKGKFHERCRTLLLSATPYKMFTMAGEVGDEDHYRDFLETAGFLFGDGDQPEELRVHLAQLRREMLRLNPANRQQVLDLRGRIESILRRAMVRTERLAVTSDRNGMLKTVANDGVALERSDVDAYLGLQAVARAVDHGDAIEYWKSAPYLLNFMEERYKLKRDFVASSKGGLAGVSGRKPGFLDWSDIEAYSKLDAGNARLRQLNDEMVDSKAWKLLWLPPSLPYYGLEGAFAEPSVQGLTKRLIFSAWHVAPKAIASVLSYSAEREMMCSRGGRPLNTPEARAKRARLLEFSRSPGRLRGMPVLALIYPSRSLATKLDPLALATELRQEAEAMPGRAALLGLARERCRELLRPVVEELAVLDGEDEAWYWAAPFLIDRQSDAEATERWLGQPDLVSKWSDAEVRERADDASGFADHVDRARKLVAGKVALGQPPGDLASAVAELGVAGPANCLLRALERVADQTELGDESKDAAATTAFTFRRLFNAPEVTALVRGKRKSVPYWRRVLEYSIDGCLQSALDEYAHVLVEGLGLIDKPPATRLERVSAEIRRSVGMRPSRIRVDDIDTARPGEPIIRREMRAKFAARFGVEESPDEGTEPTRSDQVRTAFNSPFWPFVLASTSVGQEGLDFHVYCHAVVHWNLPSNPVDLEQREGRVHRYKGHAVRKNLASVHGADAIRSGAKDPWTEMFDRARAGRAESDTDLVPYWIYATEGGACIERHVPTLPLSRDAARFDDLVRSLAVYRMVFGQPRQDDLVELLLAQLPEDEDQAERQALLEELRIDLSPSR